MSSDPTCMQCGMAFEQVVGRGRPRKYCRRCSPPKVGRSRLRLCPLGGTADTTSPPLTVPGSTLRCVICLSPIGDGRSASTCSQRCSGHAWRAGRRSHHAACERCGNTLPPNHSKFCSARCRVEPSGDVVDCRICGVEFQRTTSAQTCSPECSLELKRERYQRKNRRRRLRSTPGTYTLRQIAERDGCRCHLCGRKVDITLSGMMKWGPTIDHLVPLSDDGSDTPENVALAHRHCNVSRGNRGEVQLRLAG